MIIRQVFNKKEWEGFVLDQKPNIFLQSWNWGQTHLQLGKKVFRLGLFEKGRMIGAAQIIKEKSRRGSYFILPGGPILLKWKNEWLKTLFQEIKRIGKEEKAIFVRIRPNIENSKTNQRVFKRFDFIKAPMHLHAESTLQLNLTQPLEALLASMRKNTRYAIRRAEREGVKTELSQDIKDIKLLYQLQMESVSRHQFVPFSEKFFQSHFQAFLKDNQIVFIKASYKGEVVSIGMFVFYGDTAVYHYSGSASKYPKISASSLMIWRAVQEAKKRGCQFFDLWGIAPKDKPHHRFSGVSLFKRGFGGQEIDYLSAQDLPFTFFYWPSYFFETLRRLHRRL